MPYVLPVAEVVARIRSQGGLVYAPHPFDDGRSSLGRVLPGLCAAGAVDIVEVFNAKIATREPNERAAALATAHALPGAAGSDAHDPAGVGAAYLEMPDFDGPASFLAALADARITGEYRPHAPRYPRAPGAQATPTGRSGSPAAPGGSAPSPRNSSLALARLKYRWASCSQVKPMPPWIWMFSAATWK